DSIWFNFDLADSDNRLTIIPWIDINRNGVVDTSTDKQLKPFTGLFDNIAFGPLIYDNDRIGGKVSLYLGRTALVPGFPCIIDVFDEDSSTANDMIMVYSMSLPAAVISGVVVIPGVTPPSAELANILVSAQVDTDFILQMGSYAALTDSNGNYNIQLDELGLRWKIIVEDYKNGLVNPKPQFKRVNANDNVDTFCYQQITHTITGTIVDKRGQPLKEGAEITLQRPDDQDKNVYQAQLDEQGSYNLHLAADDTGEWMLKCELAFSHDFINPPKRKVTINTDSLCAEGL
ncbi:MAG: carboxypeptidase-like regulatory domain-containing protein, partial [bacterium]